MSHSRSSSECVDHLKEILPTFIEDFIRDFEFADVFVFVKTLFTSNELSAIKREKDLERQNLRLLWILGNKSSEDVHAFLQAISRDYTWLVTKIEDSCLTKSWRVYTEFVKHYRSEDQKHTDFNVHRIDLYCKLKRSLRRLKRNHFVILSGNLGTGKKWLTKDVCYDHSVLQAMDFKIFFIDVENCTSPEDDLQNLGRLRILIGDTSGGETSPHGSGYLHTKPNFLDKEYMISISNRILALQQNLRKQLQSPEFEKCLLVLQNVKNVKSWKAFNLGCKTLIITRNKCVAESISREMCEHMEIESGLEEDEFYELFEKILKQKREDFPPIALDIYSQSNGHPRILSLIAVNIKNLRMTWDEWLDCLEQSKITDTKLNSVLEKSINMVVNHQLLHYYVTFSIFPHSIEIPINLLAALWDVSEKDAKNIIDKFYKMSFLTYVRASETNELSCQIPFIYSSYFENSQIIQEKLPDTKALHNKVVNYYEIDKVLEERSEPNLFAGQHKYFFLCLEHHLKEAGRIDLFSKLYLDYGFLQQKLRAVGLLNVLRNLKFYEKEITNNDHRRRKTLMEISDFLPKIEEKLVYSNDTCLLQYALMATGEVYKEALEQVKRFPNHVWFRENGYFHQRRQIAQIPKPPKIVHSLENDSCLILLENNELILTDISTDSRKSQILFENTANGNESMKNTEIFEVRLFNENNFFLTLDTKGQLKLWSISNNSRRYSLVDRSASKKQKVNPLRFNQNSKQTKRQCKQAIHDNPEARRGKIVAFYVEENAKSEIYLHLAFDNGIICVFTWDPRTEDFHYSRTPLLQTSIFGIRVIMKILLSYYFIVNASGDVYVRNLRDSSQMPITFSWPKLKDSNGRAPVLISYEMKFNSKACWLVFVFNNEVFKLRLDKTYNETLIGDSETIYKTGNAENAITCARLSSDWKYLLLGTKFGLVVIDMVSNSEVLRSNVSDAISCVDICPLDDKVYKYYVACGVKKKNFLYLFSILQTPSDAIVWSHNESNLSNKETQEGFKDPQLDPGVWLMGKKLYSVVYGTSSYLLAVDSKRRIHKVWIGDSKKWDIIEPNMQDKNCDITAVTAFGDTCFIGYDNGDLFNLTDECFDPNFMDRSIVFLQLINEKILVVATAFETRVMNIDSHTVLKQLPEPFHFCFQLFDKYLILVNHYGVVQALHLGDIAKEVLRLELLEQFCLDSIVACDLKGSFLYLALSNPDLIMLCRFFDVNGELSYKNFELKLVENMDPEKHFTCLKASSNGELVAIGTASGSIDIFKLRGYDLGRIFTLQSVKSRINDLKFSPNNDVLISCGDQLCFWSITYIINNQFPPNTPKRHSSRFKSQTSYDVEEVDAKVVDTGSKPWQHYLNAHNNNTTTNGNLMPTLSKKYLHHNANTSEDYEPLKWENKKGYSDKPELLASLKFDGNEAELIFTNDDFTHFNTIDDEGVYYHLELYDFIKTNPYNEADINEADANANIEIITTDHNHTMSPYLDTTSFNRKHLSKDFDTVDIADSIDIVEGKMPHI